MPGGEVLGEEGVERVALVERGQPGELGPN